MLFGFVTNPDSSNSPGDRPPPTGGAHDGAIGTFGMWVFLAALFGLFASLLVVILIKRAESPHWPAGITHMPLGLWLATALLMGVSLVAQQALSQVRQDHNERVRRYLVLTSVLVLLFLAVQTVNWVAMFTRPENDFARGFLGIFYLFTLFHAAHVIGGLVPVIWVTRKAFRNAYTRHFHMGIRNCALYWHFVDVVWLIMLPAMFWPKG